MIAFGYVLPSNSLNNSRGLDQSPALPQGNTEKD